MGDIGYIEGKSTADLKQYAVLFLKNNINGQRLLMLSQDDLRLMGMTSQGHIMELHVSHVGIRS